MSASEVQHRSTFSANVTSVALAFASAVTGGNLLAYLTSDFPQASVLAATDNNSNTIANAVSQQTTDGDNRVDYVKNANAGATTVTAHANSGGATLFLHIREISGCDTTTQPRDTGTAHSATASVSTSGSTSQSGDAVVAFFSDSPVADTLTVGSGYTDFELTQDSVNNNEAACSEYKTATASGTQTATCGGNGTDVLVQTIVVFKQAAAGGTTIVIDDTEVSTEVEEQLPSSALQQELQDTFGIVPPRPPFAYEDDGANIRWSDWRALHYEDPETQRALPPVPPVSIQEEFTEQLNVDWRARQYEDTDTHRALPPTPPFAIQDEHQDEKNVNWSAIQYEDAETQRALPPTPPFAIQDEISDRALPGVVPFFEEDQPGKPIVVAPAPNIGLDDIEAHIKAFDRVGVYQEDDRSLFPPAPPFVVPEDTAEKWTASSAVAIEDDRSLFPPTPPFVVPEDTAEKWTASSAAAIEDDQATLPPIPPLPPFSIQEEEQYPWRSWTAPALEDDWSTTAQRPPFAFEDDLKTLAAAPTYFSISDTDFTGTPPVPQRFWDDEHPLQRYSVAGLSGLIVLDEFVGAPIAAGLGPPSLTSIFAAVRPAIDSLGLAVRPAVDSQAASVRPAIDSQSAGTRPVIDSQSAATRPAIDSESSSVRPS